MSLLKANRKVNEDILERMINYYTNQNTRFSNHDAEGLRKTVGINLNNNGEFDTTQITLMQKAKSMFRNRNGEYDVSHVAGGLTPAVGAYSLIW